MGHPHLLPGGDQVEAAAGVQPVGAARHLGVPAIERVEPADQSQQAVLGAVDVGAQIDDLGDERLDGVRVGGCGHGEIE
jgi:hypothetical protein